MSVHDDSHVNAEGVAKNDIRGFAANTTEAGQFVHGARDFTGVVLDDGLAGGFDAFGFVAEEAGGSDFFFEFREGGVGVIGGGAIFLEKERRDHIHTFVGALGGENRGDKEFEGI